MGSKKIAKVDRSKIDHQALAELVRKRSKVLLVPVEKIHPNPWNKNAMGTHYFEALKANLSDSNVGFTTPIQVRPHPTIKGDYEIVDGEHRWKGAKEVGYREIPCLHLGEISDALLKYMMLEANAIHGQTADEDLKKIVQEIQEDPIFQQMQNDLYTMLATEAPLDDGAKYALEEDELPNPDAIETTLVQLYLTDDQLDEYRRIVGQIRLSHGVTAEEAVLLMVRHFAETTGLGVATGDEILDEKQSDLVGKKGGRKK